MFHFFLRICIVFYASAGFFHPTAHADTENPYLSALLIDFRQVDGAIDEVPSLYARACLQGNALACKSKQWRGSEYADWARARVVFNSQCKAKEPYACLVMGWMNTQSTPNKTSSAAADPFQGAKEFATACNEGVPRGCSELADLYLQGVGVEKDTTEAMRLYLAACQKGDADACTPLESLSSKFRALKDAPDLASGMFAELCEENLNRACKKLQRIGESVMPGSEPAPTQTQPPSKSADTVTISKPSPFTGTKPSSPQPPQHVTFQKHRVLI